MKVLGSECVKVLAQTVHQFLFYLSSVSEREISPDRPENLRGTYKALLLDRCIYALYAYKALYQLISEFICMSADV